MLTAPFRAVLDACVLYPMPLCDTLVRLGATGLVQIKRATREGAARRDAALRGTFPEAMVTGYEALIASMQNHKQDRHVAAVAMKAAAQLIVTFNLRDFARLPDGIAAVHPDEFLCDLLDLDQRAVLATLARQVAALRRPAQTVDDLLQKLADHGTPKFAAAARTARQ